jgi:hypothetical protein
MRLRHLHIPGCQVSEGNTRGKKTANTTEITTENTPEMYDGISIINRLFSNHWKSDVYSGVLRVFDLGYFGRLGPTFNIAWQKLRKLGNPTM